MHRMVSGLSEVVLAGLVRGKDGREGEEVEVKCEEEKNDGKGIERREGEKGGKKKGLPQISSYRICDFEEQHSWGIYDPQTLNGGNILGKDELRVCSWAEETFSVSRKLKSKQVRLIGRRWKGEEGRRKE